MSLHIASQVVVFGGSQFSPAVTSTQPSPQTDAVHTPVLHKPPAHVVQSIWFAPAVQLLPVCPPTMTFAHVSVPLHVFMSTQSVSMLQEYVQLVSQPVFGPFPAPKSQISPISKTPFPQTAAGA
jgi:hypothetical protein